MSKMITWAWIEAKAPCGAAQAWGREKYDGKEKIDGGDVVSDLMKVDKLSWANWLIVRLMDKPQRVRYAIFAAEQVLSIFERKYPKDDRPRKAIEAAKAWVDQPTDKKRRANAAYAYADAAYAAAARSRLQKKVIENGLKILEERP